MTNNIKAALLVASLLVVVTLSFTLKASSNGYDVSGLEASKVELVQKAANAWCDATKGACCVSLDGGSNSLVGVIELHNSKGRSCKGLYQAWNKDSDRILIRRNLNDQVFYATVLHELGHHCQKVLKSTCEHTSDSQSVMTAYEDVSTITAQDIQCVGGK